MKTSFKPLLISLAAIIVVFSAWFAVDKYLTPKPVGGDSVLAKPAPALRRAPTALVAVKAPVKTYQGETKANLKLPPLVQADSNQQVVAAAQVKSDLRPQTVTTVLNTETGKVDTYIKTDPYPVFAIEARGEITTAYGYKLRIGDIAPKPVVRLQAKYDVVRVKALTAGVVATLDSDRDAFVGLGISYKW